VALLLLIAGFVSILGQVVLLRELNVAFYGVELIYVLAMGVWLLWTAAGAVIGRRRSTPSRTLVGWLVVLLAVLLPLDVAGIRWLREASGGIPGTYLPFGRQLIAVLLVLCPIGITLGLLFQKAAKLFIAERKTLALAYAIESAGGLLGGLAATLLLKYGVQNLAIALFCGLSSVGAILAFLSRERGSLRLVTIIVSVLLVVALVFSSPVDRYLTRLNHPDLLDTEDSPYGRITITRRADQFVVFENDALAFETQGVAAEELVHLAALHGHNPRRVLVLGGGLGGILAEILKYSPEKVDYVELNPTLLALARKNLPPTRLEPLSADVVEIHIADPRDFVRGAGRYDLILVGMSDPTSGLSNRFYTREFFARCAAILRTDGVLAFRLATSENIWTRFVMYRNASVINALRDVFHDIRVFPATANVVIASQNELPRDPTIISEGLKRRGIETKLVTPPYIQYLYTNDRFFDLARRLESTPAPPNTDTRPVCYRYASMIWLSKFIPAMINWDAGSFDTSMASHAVAYGVILLLIGIGFLLIRRRLKIRRAVLVAVAGFVGMVLESGIILHYQVTSGVLFLNVGVLLMAVMAGLALGAILILQTAAAKPGKARSIGRGVGYGLLGGFAFVSAGFAGLASLGFAASLLVSSLLLFVTGLLVSGLFAYASLWRVDEQRAVVSPLYAADLLGGFAGALLGSLLLIPFVGLPETALMMLALAVAALLLI